TGEPLGRREIMQESARIARGQVTDLKSLRADEFDGLIFPGGMGAAVHLCTWSVDGSQCTVLPEVERVVREFHSAKKPICAICIAPVIVAKVLGSEGVTVTVGDSVE